MIETDFYPSGLTYSTITTAVTTISSASTHEAFFMTVETAAIRYRIDGGDPTPLHGHKVNIGGYAHHANNKAVRNLKVRAFTSASTANVQISFFDRG